MIHTCLQQLDSREECWDVACLSEQAVEVSCCLSFLSTPTYTTSLFLNNSLPTSHPPLFLRNLIYYQRIHNSRKISPQAFPPSCQVLSLTPFSPTFISGSSPMPCSQHLWRNIQPPPLCRFLLQHNGALALRSVLLQWTLFVLMYPHYLGPPFSLLLPVAMVSPCGGEHGEHGLTWREKLPPTLKLRQGVT